MREKERNCPFNNRVGRGRGKTWSRWGSSQSV